MSQMYLGLDISKETLDACLWSEQRRRHQRFGNTPAGHQALLAWLKREHAEDVHACMEATSTYGDALAETLVAAAMAVSVVNPSRIKSFADSQMRRTKTDRLDAEIIAEFCRCHQPELWRPPAPELRALQSLLRHRDALLSTRDEHRNRLESSRSIESVRSSLERMIETTVREIDAINREIARHINQHPGLKSDCDLLSSIGGIGTQTAAQILSEVPEIRRFAAARQVGSFAGLTPSARQSGSSLNWGGRISKKGSARLRKALYMPALAALRSNPVIKALAERMKERGKQPLAIITAAMRKLLELAYGVLKSGVPFDPNYAVASAR
jgi:transposase